MNTSATLDLEAFRRFAARLPAVKPVTADVVQPEPQAAFPVEARWLKAGTTGLFDTQQSPMAATADVVQPEQYPPFPTEPIWLKR